MSQNKTVIQGLEPDPNMGGTRNMNGARGTASPDFYSRGANQSARGTVVPGMMENSRGMNAESGQELSRGGNQVSIRNIQPGKPIVGFLYSISRTPIGEYWPLQIGRNTIGQSESSDVRLLESTVSADHAIIVIRQMKNTGGVIAAITDTQSSNGTMINGETIGFSPVECHNGDIITVGNNYEFVFILIDSAQLGLSVSKDFIQVDAADEENYDYPEDLPPFGNNGSTRPGGGGGFTPYDGPTQWEPGTRGYGLNDGTIGMDGSNGNNRGGTKSM